jgi:hypothetical protein
MVVGRVPGVTGDACHAESPPVRSYVGGSNPLASGGAAHPESKAHSQRLRRLAVRTHHIPKGLDDATPTLIVERPEMVAQFLTPK